MKKTHTFKGFLPLILIVALVLGLDLGYQWYLGSFNLMTSMRLFMAFFFLGFGLLKILDWKGFIKAYAEYDLIAAKSKVYAAVYPLLEISLGLLYLFGIQLFWTNIATLILMLIGSVGVIKVVLSGREIRCACMGTLVNLPMTVVTIVEDVGMGVMALVMLFMGM